MQLAKFGLPLKGTKIVFKKSQIRVLTVKFPALFKTQNKCLNDSVYNLSMF